jgi:hypothetical protein
MPDIYTATYTDQTGLYKARPVLLVPSAKMGSFQIPFKPAGYLTRLVVMQQPAAGGGGTSVAFTVELLTSQIPYPPGVAYATTDAPAVDMTPYRVQSPQTAALTANAGAAVLITTNEIGLAYRNLDGGDSEGFLYLVIKPTGAITATNWYAFLQARVETAR